MLRSHRATLKYRQPCKQPFGQYGKTVIEKKEEVALIRCSTSLSRPQSLLNMLPKCVKSCASRRSPYTKKEMRKSHRTSVFLARTMSPARLYAVEAALEGFGRIGGDSSIVGILKLKNSVTRDVGFCFETSNVEETTIQAV